MDCGPTCLQMIAEYYGQYYSLQTLREKSYLTRNGSSLKGINSAAKSIGFKTESVWMNWEQLIQNTHLPCIIHWDNNHFIVVYSIKSENKILVADPAFGKLTYNKGDFLKHWITDKKNNVGIVFQLKPTSKLKRRQCKISSSNVCQVVLRYTKSCNLSCSYCYAHTDLKPPTSMSNETVLYILRKLSKSYPEKVLNLSFHGGEPLLNYNKLVPLVKEIRKIFENIKFYIQTNGTLVTKEIAGFLKAENFNVGISIDGFDTVSNSHRCQLNGSSSLKQSLIGLDYLLAAGISPGMFTVVTAANQYKLLDHFDFYVGKGIKKFNFSPILHSGKAADKKYDVNINHLIETNLKLMEKINLINNECNNIEDYISEVNISNLLNNLSSLNIYNLCTLAPCGAGHTMLGFDIDGSFYSCDYFIGNLEFKIGNIYEVDDIKNSIFRNPSVQNLLKRNIDSIKECRMCTWKNVCTYHCASDSYFNHKTLYKPHSMCEYVKKIIPRIIGRKKISINNIPPC